MQTTTQTHALQIIDSLITSIELAEKQLQLLPTTNHQPLTTNSNKTPCAPPQKQSASNRQQLT